MGLAEAIQRQREHRRPGPRCGVCNLVDQLEGDDLESFLVALEDRTVSNRHLSMALDEEGLARLSQHTLARHRRGDCAG